MQDATRLEVLDALRGMIREILGDMGDLGPPIEPATSFAADLELESIELVALAEKLRARYGERIDFAGWLGGMELDQILALTVGDLVDHVAACLSS